MCTTERSSGFAHIDIQASTWTYVIMQQKRLSVGWRDESLLGVVHVRFYIAKMVVVFTTLFYR